MTRTKLDLETNVGGAVAARAVTFTTRLPARFVATLLASLLAACGGATEPAAKAPAAPPPAEASAGSEPRTVAEAQAEIARTRAVLEGPAPKKEAKASDAPSPEQGTPPLPAPAKSEPRKDTRREGDKGGVSDDASSACSDSCRALASMRRAVGALCRMTGDDDARCLDARKTLADSEGKLPTCRCP